MAFKDAPASVTGMSLSADSAALHFGHASFVASRRAQCHKRAFHLSYNDINATKMIYLFEIDKQNHTH